MPLDGGGETPMMEEGRCPLMRGEVPLDGGGEVPLDGGGKVPLDEGGGVP